MDLTILEVVGKLAGVAGLGLGVLLIIFRNIIAKNIFPTLTKKQAARTILLIIILTWSIALSGLGAWVYLQSRENSASTSVKPYSHDQAKIYAKVYERGFRDPVENEMDFGVRIEYPEISGLKTELLTQKVNEKIKIAAMLYRAQDENDLHALVNYKIKYRWKNFLEFFFDYWLYHDGAAHQVALNKSLVLNLDNGEEYELKDLFRTGYEKQLTALVKNSLNKIDYIGHFFGKPCTHQNDWGCYPQIKGNENYAYNGQYLYIYFSQYEIAPSAMGPVTAKIELQEMKRFINPNGPIAFLL